MIFLKLLRQKFAQWQCHASTENYDFILAVVNMLHEAKSIWLGYGLAFVPLPHTCQPRAESRLIPGQVDRNPWTPPPTSFANPA